LKNHSWTYIEKFKKHISEDHCRYVIKDHGLYQKKWKNISGIYKITYLNNKLFTYYGSSKNIGARFKYHYYNGKNQNNFLGLFLNAFGWFYFSFTLIEQCYENKLRTRENWYLYKYKPLLNYLTHSYRDPRKLQVMSPITKRKISVSLIGKTMSLETRKKMSISKRGFKNFYFGKKLHPSTLLAAQKIRGKLIYVYNEKDLSLVNNIPFVSIREIAKNLPINPGTLVKKLYFGLPFKGYYYFSKYL